MLNIIIILLFIQSNLLCWEQFAPDKVNFDSKFIGRLFNDSNGRIWVTMANSQKLGIYVYNDNVWEDLSKIRPDFDNMPVINIAEDEFGNIIFTTKMSIIIYTNKNKWYSSSNSQKNLDFFIYSQGNIFYYKNKLFINHGFPSRIFYFEYNKDLEKYDLENLKYIEIEELKYFGLTLSVIRNNKILSKGVTGFTEIDIEPFSWNYLLNQKGDTLKYDLVNTSNFKLIGENAFLVFARDSIYKLTKTNEIQKIIIPKDEDKPDALSIGDYVYIEDFRGVLFGRANKLYLIRDSNNEILEILLPKEMTNEDNGFEWGISNLEFDGEFLWIGTFNHYLYKIHKTELEPKLNVQTNNSGLSEIGTIKIFPNPNKNTIVNIEFYNLLKNIDIKYKLFDINGTFLGIPKVQNQSVYNDIYNVTLEIPKLDKGIYFIQLSNDKIQKTFKFIKE